MSEYGNITFYPQFSDLKISHKAVFDKLFEENPPQISEFTFTNLYCWRNAYNFKLSRLKEALLIRSGAQDSFAFLAPIGEKVAPAALTDVMQESKAKFIRIPEDKLSMFGKEGDFSIEEDRDNADYLYLSADLIELRGRKYDGKRNLIKKFEKSHTYQYVNVDATHTACMVEFQEYWCKLKNCGDSPGLLNERMALSELIKNFTAFQLLAGAIKVDGKIRALAIGEKLNPETLVLHFLKADPSLPGLYQVINNEFMRACAGAFKYANLEQDLGVAGLRKFKLSYHPVRLIRKFTVSLSR